MTTTTQGGIMNTEGRGKPLKNERSVEMKQDYIEAIERLMQACNDISLLDLIYQLLGK